MMLKRFRELDDGFADGHGAKRSERKVVGSSAGLSVGLYNGLRSLKPATLMRRVVTAGLGLAGGFVLATNLVVPGDGSRVLPRANSQLHPSGHSTAVPPRSAQLDRLKAVSQVPETQEPFNVLVIGGGATGSGCALDATTRGLKTLLVESEDFAAGTSSRSTKLVHGGVRYLEKAVKNLDYGQLKLVFEALHERKTVLDIAPHLASTLPIMTPCYSWWEIPYYWAGLKAYDLVAGSRALAWSHFVPPSRATAAFPTLCKLRKDGKSLKGTIVYYDGQFNDARLAVSLACTAAARGAVVLNHATVTSLIKDKDTGKVAGATIRDEMTGKSYSVHADVVINAAGPFADTIRKLSDPDVRPMIMPSAGVHVTLPDYYSPDNLGMIVPKTKDGRVVFMLPWLGETIAGTTDSSSEITMRPQPTEEEIRFILESISEFLTVKVRREDVKSAWSGIRPLAVDPSAEDTASALRDHVVQVGKDGLITITGGKWTTYRLMSEDAVNAAVKQLELGRERGTVVPMHGPCITTQLPLIGAAGWSPALFTQVAQNYTVPHRPGAIDTRVAKYLAAAYGGQAHEVTRLAEEMGLGRRLVRGYPVIESEVIYTMRNEYCETPEDFVARRTRLAFLDKAACLDALPRVVELMAMEKGWSRKRQHAELARARAFLETFEAKGGQEVHPSLLQGAKGSQGVTVGSVDSSAAAAGSQR